MGLKQFFNSLLKKDGTEQKRKYHCSHCGKEIGYEEYEYGCELCPSCAEGSCMG